MHKKIIIVYKHLTILSQCKTWCHTFFY